jgi:dihydrofolate reductase
MRRLVYFVATTIDGLIGAPDGTFDFFPMGEQVGHQAATYPETIPAHLRDSLGASDTPCRFDTVLMGRRTYQPALDAGVEDPYDPLETFVFSDSLPAGGSGRLRVTSENPATLVQRLKASSGRDIWLCGGGHLAAQLADEIDEITVKVNPLVIGSGIGLMPGPFTPRRLQLRDHTVFDSGVVWLTYDVLGHR